MNVNKLEKNLDRQLYWVQAADSKVAPLFAINLAMLGLLAALFKENRSWSAWEILFSVAATLPLLLSVLTVLLVLFPRLDGPKESSIFFGGIAKQDAGRFNKRQLTLSKKDYCNDLLNQTYRNAEIANQKYGNLKQAYILTVISIPGWLCVIYALNFQTN